MSVKNKLVMLVDDDPAIIEALRFQLTRLDFTVVACVDGRSFFTQLEAALPQLIIMDWTLPDMTGPEICQLLRARQINVPVLMLTGRSLPVDVAQGLSSGADDYLSKPFSSVELLARVQALLRRSSHNASVASHAAASLVLGDLVLDADSRRVTWRGANIELSPKEFMLLKVLMLNAGKVLSTEQLLNQVWGYDFSGDAKTVAVHVRWLRRKLEDDPTQPRLLETVHRSGYRLNLL